MGDPWTFFGKGHDTNEDSEQVELCESDKQVGPKMQYAIAEST